MKRFLAILPVMALGLAPVMPANAAAPPGPYFNGFEKNLDGWFDLSSGNFGHITRQQSGYTNGGGYADGINSAAGHWHARISGDPCFTGSNQDCLGPNTNWGGYSSTFPPGGYRTQVDIYLDVNWAASHNDVRFDWSSAINDNTGSQRRDWVFNVGTQLTGTPHFIIQSSTNAFRSGANPNAPCPSPNTPPNTCRPPVYITTSGWYTFRHTFHDDGSGFLEVDFDIFALDSGAHLMHQTIDSNPYDPMSMVGGNRYGWFANDEIPDLAIDNSLRVGLCRRGAGDGDVQDNNSGKHGHVHFNGNECEGGQSGGDIEESDQNSGDNFQSNSVSSATFTQNESSQTMTMIGTGTHNGLPVAFTLVGVDNGTLGPGLFSLVLSDGYVLAGSVSNGTVTIQ